MSVTLDNHFSSYLIEVTFLATFAWGKRASSLKIDLHLFATHSLLLDIVQAKIPSYSFRGMYQQYHPTPPPPPSCFCVSQWEPHF